MKNTMTGNRVLLKLAGKVVGSAVQNVDMQDDLGLQDVDGLGEAEAMELVVGKVTHTISLSKYFIAKQSLIELGYVPEAGAYLTSGELSIEIIDKSSGQTIEHYSGCKAASHSRTYGKHTISSENVTFRATTKH
jgi:hypothetical protein